MTNASIARLQGRWRQSQSVHGMFERTVKIKNIDTPVQLILQLIPKQPRQVQWHCIAIAGSTLRGEGYAHRQAQAAHNAITMMLGHMPAKELQD